MIQIALLAVSIALVVMGVKGFTASGIPLSKNVVLNGTSGKIVGVICIIAGLLFIPTFLLIFWAYASRN
jgi:hypothetical protein